MLRRVRAEWQQGRLRRWNLASLLAAKVWTRWLSREFRSIGPGSVVWLPCSIFGVENISLGRDVHLGPGCRMGTLRGAELTIGDGCEIVGGSSFFALTEGIEIGRSVLMAWNVQIYDALHASQDRDKPIREQGLTRGGRVRVGDGAWLGANVVVLPGVTIGRNAVIGANAVVTKDVPDHATAVGVPAAVIGDEQRGPRG
ncbi:MAG TPA: acyltransferase [Solirubrobacteraceae bacterium]|nr:acyltransferase [Solirubrobacteraceae bacterium]